MPIAKNRPRIVYQAPRPSVDKLMTTTLGATTTVLLRIDSTVGLQINYHRRIEVRATGTVTVRCRYIDCGAIVTTFQLRIKPTSDNPQLARKHWATIRRAVRDQFITNYQQETHHAYCH